jgi:hypothetical protein
MRFCEDKSKVKMIINHGHVGGGRGFLLFNVGAIGLQFEKVIIHLQSLFCSIRG